MHEQARKAEQARKVQEGLALKAKFEEEDRRSVLSLLHTLHLAYDSLSHSHPLCLSLGRLDQLRLEKAAELERMGVPEKYRTELLKKRHTTSA